MSSNFYAFTKNAALCLAFCFAFVLALNLKLLTHEILEFYFLDVNIINLETENFIFVSISLIFTNVLP